ncbi:tRNA lysidine(34) synthetase TilS [Reyranella sp.]|uniref:tRNA lysidine(34) synthetase TilS n=1 Tax=Reyranella sp. TaxID=1929291 RepID=UPI002731140F|nr:tRNA lysidine(34) synthetase TilS [Reyranella sp.]MDP2374667.1 tRNA lysidine(34) synthetase TilS [Reyranella sp.]
MRVTPADALPVDVGAFARAMAPFEPFEKKPVVAVAVSGGRDSLALALLAHDWARVRGGAIVALIVDHGLRSGSDGEAASTRDLLAGLGIEAGVLCWSGAKPQSGLQEAARTARYRLLSDECRRRGILHLLLAHHADDQEETVTMRAARGSGLDGLAGMAALVERPDVRLLRPLLAVRRARLTATLLARGVAWVDDPSNTDLRFERARLRAAPASTAVAVAERGLRAAGERRLAQAAVEMLEFDQAGAAIIDRAGFCRLGVDLQARLLSRVVLAIGGREHAPRRDRAERAARRLAAPVVRGKSGKGQDFTLSACRLTLRQAPGGRRLRWIVWPESGRNGRQPLVPAEFFACGGRVASHVD